MYSKCETRALLPWVSRLSYRQSRYHNIGGNKHGHPMMWLKMNMLVTSLPYIDEWIRSFRGTNLYYLLILRTQTPCGHHRWQLVDLIWQTSYIVELVRQGELSQRGRVVTRSWRWSVKVGCESPIKSDKPVIHEARKSIRLQECRVHYSIGE